MRWRPSQGPGSNGLFFGGYRLCCISLETCLKRSSTGRTRHGDDGVEPRVFWHQPCVDMPKITGATGFIRFDLVWHHPCASQALRSCDMQPLTAEPSPRVIDASTAGLSQRDKFGFWQEVVCKAVVDLECRPDGKSPFEASVSGTRLSALSVARIEASSHRVARLPAGISRSCDESLIFNFILSGVALAEQDGRSVLLKPGDGAVCDAQRPYTLRFDDAFKLITVKVPRVSLSHRSARRPSHHRAQPDGSGPDVPDIVRLPRRFESTAAVSGRRCVREGWAQFLGAACIGARRGHSSVRRCRCPNTEPRRLFV